MNYYQRGLELKEILIGDRRFLHQNPEIGFDLPITTSYVWDRLSEMGYEPVKCGRSGITATVGRGHADDKVFLLRADMDALPMYEESGLPFASTVERAHTCGHDMHTAMLLGAAQMLMENERALQGTVKLMFQPAEEILEGAKSMIAAGVLEQPRVSAAMGMHMMPMAPTGMLGYNVGAVSASSDTLHITIQGKGGHGAQPDLSIDPINVVAHVHIALQELISREVDPKESVVLTFGSMQAGEAHNIIPDTAEMKGTLRTFNQQVREFALQRIEEITVHTAQAFRASAKVERTGSTSSVLVDSKVAEIVAESLQELFGPGRVHKVAQQAEGSEDFSEVTQRVPSMFLVLGAGSRQEGYEYGLHNPKVRFNEECLPIGAAAYAQAATQWLSHLANDR